MIYVVSTVRIHPGTLEPFVEAAYPAIETTRREPGCILYDLHASVTDPYRLVFTSQWESREAFNTHLESPHMLALCETNKPLVLGAKVEIIHPERVEVL
ncbi:hypothetical protein VW29_09105 [Devosia limi DSM 17137]|uniref:Quinol monooxygenase YgiN n=1 Tax=Devosia limi DSM 17137 TaxID=1121477 RepID=A0A0F5LRI7_9HYPH|nr:putative quinol monooxygenase [Devosia limi]KKB84958.1 hypothetical protein VW29_09105 [Devosia limi DSM 17137]SHF03802.1 Quinol monooxygenase YgiN [Devosia limi DSM 17137]